MIVFLKGGLGNQMFQYAFGLAIGAELKTNVYFDVNSYKHKELQRGTTIRDFELNCFNIDLKTTDDLLLFRFMNGNTIFQRLLNYFIRKFKLLPVIEEKVEFVVDENMLKKIRSNSLVSGYFQTSDYFIKYEEMIRNAFTINMRQISENSMQYYGKIQKSNSVSIHVRRGDYVSSNQFNVVHGVCSTSYYTKAIEYILNTVKDPVFYIFSDDLDWVMNQEWIKELNFVPVRGNIMERSYEDLFLMSKCKHNIIANSSFSWWGAWLNSNSRKIVIAPRQWFNPSYYNAEESTLLPKTWVKI